MIGITFFRSTFLELTPCLTSILLFDAYRVAIVEKPDAGFGGFTIIACIFDIEAVASNRLVGDLFGVDPAAPPAGVSWMVLGEAEVILKFGVFFIVERAEISPYILFFFLNVIVLLHFEELGF